MEGIFVALPTRSGRIKSLIRRKAPPSTRLDDAAPNGITLSRPD
jgi:hypothetical protein